MTDQSLRVVLVSGASGALGQAVCRAFLANGDRVAGVARSWTAKPLPPGDFACLEADLESAPGARGAVQETLERFGRIDVLVHAMGGFAGGEPVSDTGAETWHSMMAINLHSAFYLFHEVLPHMLEARRGRILAVGSRTGVEPAAGLSAYGVSKAALIALVRTVAKEVKGFGITANIVLPGVIDTPANRKTSQEADSSTWVKPESIASLLVWLASEAAGDVNGAVVPVYGRS